MKDAKLLKAAEKICRRIIEWPYNGKETVGERLTSDVHEAFLAGARWQKGRDLRAVRRLSPFWTDLKFNALPVESVLKAIRGER